MTAGDPIVGIRTNGTSRLPRMAPIVFTARSEPDSGRPRDRLVAQEGGGASGTRCPSTIVTGRTTSTTDPNSARSVSIGWPGSRCSGWLMTTDQPDERQRRHQRSG